jgi:hypothetical protein
MMTKIQAIELSAEKILQGNITEAQTVMDTEYPFQKITAQGRKYTKKKWSSLYVMVLLTGIVGRS